MVTIGIFDFICSRKSRTAAIKAVNILAINDVTARYARTGDDVVIDSVDRIKDIGVDDLIDEWGTVLDCAGEHTVVYAESDVLVLTDQLDKHLNVSRLPLDVCNVIRRAEDPEDWVEAAFDYLSSNGTRGAVIDDVDDKWRDAVDVSDRMGGLILITTLNKHF